MKVIITFMALEKPVNSGNFFFYFVATLYGV